MQSYDPNQPQRSHDGTGGYYQQQPQQSQQQQPPRMTLPPASSFFGPQSSTEYHHSNTPLSEPPPSPYLTGHYNQPQSYPSTDPSTPYMHSSAISPPNYNIGPSPNYPPPPPPMQQQQQQQMYNPPPPQNIDPQGYIGVEQQHQGHPQHQHQQIPPQHHQMQMGYPSTSMVPQDHSMQMGYVHSQMDQGIMSGNFPQQQHQTYSNIVPQQQSHQMPMMHQQQQQILLPQHQQQHLQQHHHSHSGQTPPIRSEMSNNSLLRNHLRQQPPQHPSSLPSSSSMHGPLTSTTTMESIIPSDNMTQVLQMQQQQRSQPPQSSSSLQQQQQQQQQQQNSSQKQEREAAAADNNKLLTPSLPPPPSSNYNILQQQQSVMNQEMDQRRYDESNIIRYPQQAYLNPIPEQQQNYRHITPMGPPPMPHRVYHEQQQQQVSQDYHQQQQQIFESQHQQQHNQAVMPNFPTMNEPSSSINTFPTKIEKTPLSQTEISIAETVDEVIAKHSAKFPADNNVSSSTPSPPPAKKRRNTRTNDSNSESTTEQPSDGPTVKQHFAAQQTEKRKQEQHDKILTKIREDKERYKAASEAEIPEIPASNLFRSPGMTRTEFLQAHRQRKSENNQESFGKPYEKDTVVEIIEEIAGSCFPEHSPEPPPYEFSNQSFDENIQIIDNGSRSLEETLPTIENFDETLNTVTTPAKPKPKRIRKKPPPRETKVQKENKRKFLFKCLHLQRTIRSLILKNSALADETSRLFYRIKTVTEERKLLAKRVQHYERNRIRRIQSQKKKKAKAEAQQAQMFVQQENQESNYPPSVEIYEPEIIQEKVEAYPFENMMHKEMAVYLPPVKEEFGQIPYLDPSQYQFEDFHEPMGQNIDYSNAVFNVSSNFNQYSGQQNFQSFPTEMEEGIPQKHERIDAAQFQQNQFFIPEDDNSPQTFYEQPLQHQQQQQISRSQTPTFRETPNSSSSASSRPHSSLSGQIKRTIR
uniref:Uncharacterized protein n=1 Tax=Panagrolaimus sp. ES5 TaxID=591445 RepID=A0AC34FVR9_9BILA